jgi:hypothetical protein
MNKRISLLLWVTLLTACSHTDNPSFPLNDSEAKSALGQMAHNPVRLKRPLVIIGGFLDPDVSPSAFKDTFESVSIQPLIIRVNIGFCHSFEQCRENVIAAVDAACPPTDPIWTQEVDVVGASLGGLVARYSYTPSTDPSKPRRLKIARLFTVSSPMAGAKLAQAAGVSDYYRQMQPNSPFLQALSAEDAQAKYELVCYGYLDDDIVGIHNSAPPGQTPYWLNDESILPPHWAIMVDNRILADIARRLRDEPPFTRLPPSPIPD